MKTVKDMNGKEIKAGDYHTSNCAYTGEENHYIYLGKL